MYIYYTNNIDLKVFSKIIIAIYLQDHYYMHIKTRDAGWSSLVARRAHNPKVRGSNPLPATNHKVNYFQKTKYSYFKLYMSPTK